jgi:small subunit ribosomal protein S31
LWTFPIDNEQDCDEAEANVPFHEHVYLDSYLSEFPDMAAVQEFMSLVLNGLSKNSFLSLVEKKEIINWYKEYFSENMHVLKEALEAVRQENELNENLRNNYSKSSRRVS